jgi:hypothetical protein
MKISIEKTSDKVSNTPTLKYNGNPDREFKLLLVFEYKRRNYQNVRIILDRCVCTNHLTILILCDLI